MAIILGIDTGGTFTDAVIFDNQKMQLICKAKESTTKSNLCVGISHAIDALSYKDFSNIDRVHLSTTLAVNSVQEKDMHDKDYPLSKEDDGTLNACSLNRSLQHIITGWLESIKSVLACHHIRAPLFILKNDGTLMRVPQATENPISTLLSGPVASVMGGLFLSKKEDFLLVDMGGTTADITKVENGALRFSKQIIRMNDYPVRTNTLDIQTFSIGGDSHIHFNQLGNLVIGPKKVIPLCMASCKFPNLYRELLSFKRPPGYEMFCGHDTDCFMIGGRKNTTALSDFQRKIIQFLKDEPHSLFYMADHFNVDPDALGLSDLTRKGYVYRISFTPTDVLHATGQYRNYDERISKFAAETMSRFQKEPIPAFLHKCSQLITDNLVFSCMQSIANFEKKQFDFRDSPATMFLINKFLQKSDELCSFHFHIKKPIVAVGAPSGHWLSAVAKKLDTELILPPHYEVANAIGVAVCPEIRKKR